MSGQPYKYYTDVEKYRNEYLDTLNLQTNINDMNLQANKTYKETGALPAVSQMKDSRTTAEILADTEKLKIDIINTLSKISNPQFASDVVQSIMINPINQDNRLLVFTAQRINDIMEKLKHIYTYGIKGDKNDVQQFINFVISMYNDKNSIASSTKDFLLKYSGRNLGQFSTGRSDIYNELKNLLLDISNKINIMIYKLNSEYNDHILNSDIIDDAIKDDIDNIMSLFIMQTGLITEGIINLIPNDNLIKYIDNTLNKAVDNGDTFNEFGNTDEMLLQYKDYINTSLPTFSYLALAFTKVETYFDEYYANVKQVSKLAETDTPMNELLITSFKLSSEKLYKASFENLQHVLTPNEMYADTNILVLADFIKGITTMEPPNPNDEVYETPEPSMHDAYGSNNSQQSRDSYGIDDNTISSFNSGMNSSSSGNGIRKRGRPKGSGIQRKYADVVKRSIIDGKGIQEDMRFIKFGKYLINNKKLNDGILAIKRPSGNNILDFPSQRISKNMQNVIKTMVGGGMPKYEQFECLSEPEKAYLHKLSSKANILDKFSIPAPSKSQYEKDIHDFEVMRGEIMSGNDNKDLIKKFKLHIMKLSKMGALPKHDVSDILETLIQLGY